jgi:hypothetical protein
MGLTNEELAQAIEAADKKVRECGFHGPRCALTRRSTGPASASGVCSFVVRIRRLLVRLTMAQEPACTIDIAEYRRMEAMHRRHCDDDTDLHRQIARMESDHQQALMRAEEDGYAKGLRDAELGMRAQQLDIRAAIQEAEGA